MEIIAEREATHLVVKAGGRIDSLNALEFNDVLKSKIGESDRVVILDLEKLSYISSAGLRVLLMTAKALQDRDARLMLCSLSKPIREIMAISGFDKIIPVHATRSEAQASLIS